MKRIEPQWIADSIIGNSSSQKHHYLSSRLAGNMSILCIWPQSTYATVKLIAMGIFKDRSDEYSQRLDAMGGRGKVC